MYPLTLDEKHEDAVLARIEPLVDNLPGVLEHVVAQVIEDHEQGGHAAQRVQPGKLLARTAGAADEGREFCVVAASDTSVHPTQHTDSFEP